LGAQFQIKPEAHKEKFQISFKMESQHQEDFREKIEGFTLKEAQPINVEVSVS
jgi:hypothetical protein